MLDYEINLRNKLNMALKIQTKILSRNWVGWKGTLRTDKLCCDIKETEENSPPVAWCQGWSRMNKSKTPVCHFWGGVTHRHRHPSVPNWETVLLVLIASFEAVKLLIPQICRFWFQFVFVLIAWSMYEPQTRILPYSRLHEQFLFSL